MPNYLAKLSGEVLYEPRHLRSGKGYCVIDTLHLLDANGRTIEQIQTTGETMAVLESDLVAACQVLVTPIAKKAVAEKQDDFDVFDTRKFVGNMLTHIKFECSGLKQIRVAKQISKHRDGSNAYTAKCRSWIIAQKPIFTVQTKRLLEHNINQQVRKNTAVTVTTPTRRPTAQQLRRPPLSQPPPPSYDNPEQLEALPAYTALDIPPEYQPPQSRSSSFRAGRR